MYTLRHQFSHSLICCLRLVVYFSLILLVLSSAVSDVLSLLYLLDICCIFHTHLVNTMWVSTHTPMLFIRGVLGDMCCYYDNDHDMMWQCNVCTESSSDLNRSLALCFTFTLALALNKITFHSTCNKKLSTLVVVISWPSLWARSQPKLAARRWAKPEPRKRPRVA